jgi:cytochrome c551/c552
MDRFARTRQKGWKYRRWVAVRLVLAFCFPGAFAIAAEPPIDVAAALTHYRCYICHSDREPLAGPAFADIAARYKGKRDAVSYIAQDIATGVRSGGPWHMPPHPEVSAAEARAMARYIMSLGDKAIHLQAIDRQ